MSNARANTGDGSAAGRSLLEMMWQELDTIVDRLMGRAEAADGRDPGRAEGVAYCIALVQSPYAPSIEDVRAQAMDRRADREG